MRRLSWIVCLLLLTAGCAGKPSFDAAAVDALSKKMGFQLPAAARIVAYQHKHNEDSAQCYELWVVRSPESLSGPGSQTKQKRSPSPAQSLKALVEELLAEPVEPREADKTVCEYVEWRKGTTICRFRQMPTPTDWIAVLETIALH